ncbi:putative short chain dehydrogenase [Diplodia seriata]|uniref:Putative short chain dehydrogenase n=1 Tax=Diplodia seriata TaxID=420778 RepID=A0A0G2E3M0_9PEZI|nr:putative short chain dehydrogenase [Diplodia seriata]
MLHRPEPDTYCSPMPGGQESNTRFRMAPMQRFALVTGCAHGGIGEALANEFVAQGLHVIATVLPGESREHIDSSSITPFDLDVTKEESVVSLKQHVVDLTAGSLDVLVNNAGICKCSPSYNASKSALIHYGNTLRLEMAPLGVRVINIISGEVGTNILKGDAHRELPEGSYYSPLAEEFKAHVRRTPETTDRFVYARRVVAQSLKSRPPAWAFIGNVTGLVRFFDIFGFRRVWDYIFWSMFNFSKLKEENLKRVKKNL